MKLVFTALSIVALTLFFSNCNSGGEKQNDTLTETETQAYLEKGKTITAGTFSQMSARLASALETGGVSHAVQYCNTVALPLTDSLSNIYQATVRRTSMKIRNLENRPVEWEKEVLNTFFAQKTTGETLKPIVEQIDAQTVAFAAPISMLPLCLNCHGTPGETMKAEDYAVIKNLYPADEAINYAEGDLRGMWSITFKKSQ
jgi:hypothetical protein